MFASSGARGTVITAIDTIFVVRGGLEDFYTTRVEPVSHLVVFVSVLILFLSRQFEWGGNVNC